MALHSVLTGLQQNKPVAVLLHRKSNIAPAPKPIGTIVLNAVEKAGGLFRGGFVSLYRNQPNPQVCGDRRYIISQSWPALSGKISISEERHFLKQFEKVSIGVNPQL